MHSLQDSMVVPGVRAKALQVDSCCLHQSFAGQQWHAQLAGQHGCTAYSWCAGQGTAGAQPLLVSENSAGHQLHAQLAGQHSAAYSWCAGQGTAGGNPLPLQDSSCMHASVTTAALPTALLMSA